MEPDSGPDSARTTVRGQQGASSNGQQGASAEFFIPDLCASRSVLVMVLLAELVLFVHILANSGLTEFDWTLLGLQSLLVQWVVLASAAVLCQLRQPLSHVNLTVASLASLSVILFVTIASSYLARWLFPAFFLPEDQYWWVARNALVAIVLGGIVLRYFYLQQQLRLQEQLELNARLESLRSRIRPHFLFNTLNSIASLIVSRPEAAEQAVEDLSELFRASLQESDRATTVADELRLCELYLGIEQLRLGERLSVVWEVHEDTRMLAMPSLMMQPLVENAIYHGVSKMEGGGVVHISVEKIEKNIRVQIRNPIPQVAVRSQGHRIALDNIRQRLDALYGSEGSLKAVPGDESFSVELQYPIEVES